MRIQKDKYYIAEIRRTDTVSIYDNDFIIKGVANLMATSHLEKAFIILQGAEIILHPRVENLGRLGIPLSKIRQEVDNKTEAIGFNLNDMVKAWHPWNKKQRTMKRKKNRKKHFNI